MKGKVVFFIDCLVRGGKERRLVELLRHIKKSDALAVELVLMSKDIQYPEIYDLGIPIHFLIRKSRKDPRILYHLLRLCKAVNPDIIHTWDSMTSMYAAPVAKGLRIKLINGMITDSFFRNRILSRGWIRTRITFPLSDVIVGNSIAGLKAYRAPEKKSVCIYNGFDPDRIRNLVDQEVVRKNLGVETPHVVGMVAGFTERKDYRNFVLAAKKVVSQRDDVTFVAVGDGVTLNECKSMIGGKEKEFIRFLGLQTNVESIINIMDIGILTTNTERHHEGISNSILEYMALGKPVIATDSGGTKEIVADEETGYLIPPGDADILTKKIDDLLKDPDKRTRMGRSGKQSVLERFSLEAMARKYMRLYSQCVAMGSKP